MWIPKKSWHLKSGDIEKVQQVSVKNKKKKKAKKWRRNKSKDSVRKECKKYRHQKVEMQKKELHVGVASRKTLSRDATFFSK